MCVLTGLDADLLTVLPALSRHPSLKHLYLGKNFNIKNRCCRFSLSRFTAAMYLCLCVCVARVCVYGHEGACTTYASLDIRVCDFTSVLISGCRSSGESSPAAGNDSRQLIQPRLCVCLHAVCPQGSGWSPAEAGSAHTGGGLCEWETREMSAFIKRYCKMQS